jgi:hypothetical protein
VIVGSLAAAILAGSLVLHATPTGGFTSPDSVQYICASRTLVSSAELRESAGNPFVRFGPLFPFILALATGTGVDVLQGARLLNALAFGLIVVLTARLLAQLGLPRLVVVVGAFGAALAWPLVGTALWAWSDPLFALLVLVVLARLPRVCARPDAAGVLALSVPAALACLQRYPGVSIVLSGAATLLTSAQAPLRRRVALAAAFLSAASAPLAAWLARNWLLTGTVAGSRPPVHLNVCDNLSTCGARLFGWIAPGSFDHEELVRCSPIALLPLALLLALVGCGLWSALGAGRRSSAQHPPLLVALIQFIVIYVALMIAAASTTGLEPISDRYLAPAFVPLLTVVLVSLGAMTRRLAAHASVVGALVTVVLIAWLTAMGVETRQHLNEISRSGRRGFTSRIWRESPLLQWARSNVRAEFVLSNNPYPGCLWSERFVLPARELGDWASESGAEIRRRPVLLLWFWHTAHQPNAYDPRALQDRYRIDVVRSFQDGAVLKLSPRLAVP